MSPVKHTALCKAERKLQLYVPIKLADYRSTDLSLEIILSRTIQLSPNQPSLIPKCSSNLVASL